MLCQGPLAPRDDGARTPSPAACTPSAAACTPQRHSMRAVCRRVMQAAECRGHPQLPLPPPAPPTSRAVLIPTVSTAHQLLRPGRAVLTPPVRWAAWVNPDSDPKPRPQAHGGDGRVDRRSGVQRERPLQRASASGSMGGNPQPRMRNACCASQAAEPAVVRCSPGPPLPPAAPAPPLPPRWSGKRSRCSSPRQPARSRRPPAGMVGKRTTSGRIRFSGPSAPTDLRRF